jgi:cytochrome c biogenesis protein CcmG/thiol:disulfide interchange protein DsbE
MLGWAIARAAALAVVAGLLALLVWDVSRGGKGASFTSKISRGDKPPAPTFVLPVLWDHRETMPAPLRGEADDGRLAVEELRGYPIVVNFWASWCVPCKREAPAFHAVAARFGGRVVFVGLDTQDFKGAARRFLRRARVNYLSVRDGTDRTYIAYGLTGVPETFFLDRDGRAVDHAVGAVSRSDLEERVRALLRESR